MKDAKDIKWIPYEDFGKKKKPLSPEKRREFCKQLCFSQWCADGVSGINEYVTALRCLPEVTGLKDKGVRVDFVYDFINILHERGFKITKYAREEAKQRS